MNEFIASLHRYGRFWIVAGLSVFLVAIVVLCMFDFDEEMMLIAIILGLMLSWEFSDIAFLKERERLEMELADTEDKLCLARHEADNLRAELEAASKRKPATLRRKKTNETKDENKD